jgi:hypothetical protein
MTTVQPNAFLTGKHQLLVTNMGLSSFPSANPCQGQLQTPQSVPTLVMLQLQNQYFVHGSGSCSKDKSK